ncbi:MAG TPA: TetR family transcriptional regulator C-terminal domain-containing protein [Elusimicrobiota bacterium]|jgi:TetR/AcrR family transcriptional repressor of nem operon|nr:TetR family transcriptional regulator C-terminal domain-containing protein [Elusimicrobiota bacterium]
MTRRPNTEARTRILQTAYELYASGGFEAVSMERVAAKAGLKKANLFHYFRTKEILGAAVIEEAAMRHAEGMRALFSDTAQDPVTAVRGLFDRGTAGMRKDCSRGCFIGKMGQELDERNPAMRRRLEGCLRDWRGDVAAFLDAWRKRGYFRAGFKPAEAADGILALYEGGLLIAKVAGDDAPVEHARRAAVTVIAAWKA